MKETKREVTDDPIMLRIIEAVDKSGKKASELMDFLSISKNSFDNWKFRGLKSYMTYIDKIADFTGTSLDWLIRGYEPDSSMLTADEIEIVQGYRNLNVVRKNLMRDLLDNLVEVSQYEGSM